MQKKREERGLENRRNEVRGTQYIKERRKKGGSKRMTESLRNGCTAGHEGGLEGRNEG